MITNMMITALLAFNIPELLPPRRQTGLWRHGRMPAPSEFVRGGQDALLQVVERTVARFLLSGPLIASSGLRRPSRGLLHEGISCRGWPWRGAGQEFPEVVGSDHSHARVLRAEAQPSPPSLGRLRLMQGLGAESEQDCFDDRGVVEHGVRHTARFDPR